MFMAINALFLVETVYSSTKTAIDRDLCDNPSGEFLKLIVILDCFQLFFNICTMTMISFCGCRNTFVMQLYSSYHVEILVSSLLKFCKFCIICTRLVHYALWDKIIIMCPKYTTCQQPGQGNLGWKYWSGRAHVKTLKLNSLGPFKCGAQGQKCLILGNIWNGRVFM